MTDAAFQQGIIPVCEPASGASVAGLRVLLQEQMISPSDRVVCILTGHRLKDPNVTVEYHGGENTGPAPGAIERKYANPPVQGGVNIDEFAGWPGT